MSYNLKAILRDVNLSPIPQFYDPVTDAFLPLTGAILGNGRYGNDVVSWGKTAGGVFMPITVDASGNQEVLLVAGSAIIGKMGIDQTINYVSTATVSSGSIPAGSSWTANGRDVTAYGKVGFIVIPDTNHAFDFVPAFTDGVSGTLYDQRPAYQGSAAKSVGGQEDVSYTHWRPIITNNDVSPHTYTVKEKYMGIL